jgi:hypothetical protein
LTTSRANRRGILSRSAITPRIVPPNGLTNTEVRAHVNELR